MLYHTPNFAPILARKIGRCQAFLFFIFVHFSLAWRRDLPYMFVIRKRDNIGAHDMIFIFDLDGTVIDSRHRAVSKPDGSFCLDGWRRNCTAELIGRDSLLPLAHVMRKRFDEGHTVVVCTSRVCGEHDMAFLERNGLRFHHFLSRDDGDMRADAQYKSEKLAAWAAEQGLPADWRRGAMMFDDHLGVVKQMMAERLWTIDATERNAKLAAAGY